MTNLLINVCIYIYIYIDLVFVLLSVSLNAGIDENFHCPFLNQNEHLHFLT